ncbi:hypothetical protein GE09DRAFT_1056847 [Coniochaeta sp. 2T2.1]|nr:hypothetical protein GE09DRAFT_1056847 [Coniochaeta sp. 2T2.1]
MPSLTPQQTRLFEVAGFSPMWAPGHQALPGTTTVWDSEETGTRTPRDGYGAYSFPRDRYYDDSSDEYYSDDDSDDFRRDMNRDALARRAVAHMIWGTIPYGTRQALSPTGYGSPNGAQDGTAGPTPNGSGTGPMDDSTGGGPPNGTGGDQRERHAGHHGGAAPHGNAARHNRTTQHVPRQQPPSKRVTADSSASLREPYGNDQHSGRAYRLRRALSAPLQGVLVDFFARDRLVRANSPVAGSHALVGSHAVAKYPSKVGSSDTKPPARHHDAAVKQEPAVSTPHGDGKPTDAITAKEGSTRQSKDRKGKMKALPETDSVQPVEEGPDEPPGPFPSYNEPEGWQALSSTATPAVSNQQQLISHANARIDGLSSSVSIPTYTFDHANGSPPGTKPTPSVPPRLETSPWVKDLHDDNQTDPSTTGSAARLSWRKRAAQSIRRLLVHRKDPDSESGGGGVEGLWRHLRNYRRLREQERQRARLAEEMEEWRRRDKKNQETTIRIDAVGEEEPVRPRANGAVRRPGPPPFVPKQDKAQKAKSPRGHGQGQHHHRTPHQAAHDFFDEEAGRKKAEKALETAPLAGAANTVMMAAS